MNPENQAVMSSNILADRDINATAEKQPTVKDGKEVKSMEYHRQVLQSKLDEGQGKQSYISPSDNIMSPCTAKLSAYRNQAFGKTKPKSLFAKTSSKNLAVGSNSNIFARPLQTEKKDEEMRDQ